MHHGADGTRETATRRTAAGTGLPGRSSARAASPPTPAPRRQSAHTGAAQAAGWSLPDTVAIRADNAGASPGLTPPLAVAREIASSVGNVQDATWQAAREAGCSGTELAELFAHVAATRYTDYFNHYVQTDPDLPAAPGLDGRSPRPLTPAGISPCHWDDRPARIGLATVTMPHSLAAQPGSVKAATTDRHGGSRPDEGLQAVASIADPLDLQVHLGVKEQVHHRAECLGLLDHRGKRLDGLIGGDDGAPARSESGGGPTGRLAVPGCRW